MDRRFESIVKLDFSFDNSERYKVPCVFICLRSDPFKLAKCLKSADVRCDEKEFLRVRLASKWRLLLWIPGHVPFGTRIGSNVETTLSWTSNIPRYFYFALHCVLVLFVLSSNGDVKLLIEIRHFSLVEYNILKSERINNMDHTRVICIEPSSVIRDILTLT